MMNGVTDYNNDRAPTIDQKAIVPETSLLKP